MEKQIRVDKCTQCGKRLIRDCSGCDGSKCFEPIADFDEKYLLKIMKEGK
jgi:hypothetical protein